MADITVEIKGIERLTRKLEEVPQALRGVMERAVEYGREEAGKRAKPHPVDKGTLGRSVKFAVDKGAVPLHARIYTKSGIAFTVEEGRRPGKPPPVAAIRRWAKAHGIAVNPWLLAQQIRARGTKGIRFMAGAAEATQKKMGDFTKEAVREIERRWGR